MVSFTARLTEFAVDSSLAHSSTCEQALGGSLPEHFIRINPHIVYKNSGFKIAQHGPLFLAYCGDPKAQLNSKPRLLSDSESLAHFADSYLKDGTVAISKLSGHFALIIIRSDTLECVCVTDKFAVFPLFWHLSKNGELTVAASLAELKSAAGLSNHISPDALYSYLYFHMVPSPLSIYPDVYKLKPAHFLRYSGTTVQTEQYWRPHFTEESSLSVQALSEQLSSSLLSSTSSAIGNARQVGAFLSGGLDSSTVVGMLSNISDQQARSYSIGFNAKEYDETPFARITAKHFNSDYREYFVTPEDVLKIVPRIAEVYDEPFGNSSAVPTYYCAKLAVQDGIELMLAGDGGDELFAGNERYAEQRVFNYYLAIPKGLRNAVFDPVINCLPNAMPLAAKAKSYIRQANIPLPERLQEYNYLHRHDINEIFNTDFIQSVNTSYPLELLREKYNTPEHATDLNRMLYMDWKFTLADNDLRKVSTMCELAGVKVRYPLLSDELLSFSTTVPSHLKLKGNKLRYFYKYALRNYLPKQTLTKSKHGFGLPFGVWLKDYKPLRELAYDSLEALKTRDYFNPTFIDETLDMHENVHAKYYGELVWLLMMLELWLQSHQ